MIRNTLIIVATTAVVTLCVTLRGWYDVEAALSDVPAQTIKMVRDVAVQYRKDYGYEWQCSIDGQKVSLTALMLAKIANETAYGTKGIWKQINNRWNLHVPSKRASLPKRDGTSKVWADNAEMVVYNTPQEWLYDLAHRLVQRQCTVTWQTTWNYVKWPKAEKTPKRLKAVNLYYENMKKVALAYENNKKIYLVDNEETKKQAEGISEWPTAKKKECHHVATIKQADFIQVDQEDGKFVKYMQLWSKAWNVEVFNCYGTF